ncbi:Ubiquinone/menaquinone biosynthesis C-methylase UbiE [Arboricoccus pini]|uniref:Ubiquinone/menaquinone biosynthesis C-methylase UbiE n=1 Tax=Arboricoccus pini TaxID=1963835 RepID=A0A212S4D0_9PROT|nr:class I SAM-dependent methyltransferase [Arboricoccus pini]SNB79897.1 Ubiquinone/menaquinone biosynthesis C-methylase UbiE [Arboricoccus pini]
MAVDSLKDVAPTMDEVNIAAWGADDIVRHYAMASGWLDEGEREALAYALRRQPDGAVLDIGIGGGRTTELLEPMASEYVGIDISPKMIAAARLRFPEASLHCLDARDMNGLESRAFDLAFFSCAGLDAMDLAGRRAILGEVRRVLRPQGLFVFSSFNNEGPWAQSRIGLFMPRRWCDLRTLAGNVRRSLRDLFNANGRIGLLATHEQRGVERSLRLLPAFGFRVFAMFSTCRAIAAELNRQGFIIDRILTDRGEIVGDATRPPREASWFYYLARKI